MKKVAVILPLNNKEMLSQEDLQPYQAADCFFELYYVDTPLQELNSAIDAAAVMSLVLEKCQEVEQNGACAIIIYAFGDLGVKEARGLVAIPVMGLGKSAVHMASMLCRHRYTILPSMTCHNAFIEDLVFEEGLGRKFVVATKGIGVSPKELRNNAKVLEKLIDIAIFEHQEHGVDTFTLGCGCFMGIAKQLEMVLRGETNKPIIVVDPVATPFKLIQALI